MKNLPSIHSAKQSDGTHDQKAIAANLRLVADHLDNGTAHSVPLFEQIDPVTGARLILSNTIPGPQPTV